MNGIQFSITGLTMTHVTLTTVIGLIGSILFSSAAQATCNAAYEAPWKASGKLGYNLAAYAVGANCRNAIVILAVTDAKHKPIWNTSRLAEGVAVFSDEHTVNGTNMKEALKNWVQIGLETKTTEASTLPDWPAGASEPTREEFGFFIDAEIDHESYLKWRKQKRPLYCFVQGMESETCILADDSGQVWDIGGMTFPG
jgi:hypothetical protein